MNRRMRIIEVTTRDRKKGYMTDRAIVPNIEDAASFGEDVVFGGKLWTWLIDRGMSRYVNSIWDVWVDDNFNILGRYEIKQYCILTKDLQVAPNPRVIEHINRWGHGGLLFRETIRLFDDEIEIVSSVMPEDSYIMDLIESDGEMVPVIK